MVTIGVVCNKVNKINPKDNPDAEFDYIDISGIDNEQFRVAETKRYTGQTAPSRARQLVRSGDVVFSTVRTYLKNFARVTPELDGQVASTGFCVLRTATPELSKYLFYYVQFDPFLNELAKFQRGTSYPAVRDGDVFAQFIPMPPSGQAERIVAEIEKQFSRLDEAVASLKRAKANLKRYKAAVLKAAVEGKLTEEWRKANPDVEPADKLLKRILEERRRNWTGKGKYKEPAAPDTRNLPELPEGWAWASFEQLCEAVSDDGKKIARSEYLPEGAIPVIDQGEGEIGGYTDDDDLVFSGALPVIAFGDHTRRFKLVQRPFVVGADGVKLIGIRPAWAPRFLWYQFQTLDFENRGYSRHFQFVRAKPLRVPPLSEQNRIVAELDRRLSIATEGEEQINANLRRADRLRQSILKQAFSGQLVPTISDEEPAGVLLERVGANGNVGTMQLVVPKAAIGGGRGSASPFRKTKTAVSALGDFTSLDSALAAILCHMQPNREYSRAEIADALGLSIGRWNAAIQELKRRGKVRQVGERRGARYRLI
ncbi:MAG: hypothetical protein GXY54_11960 [Deltaproteobacteria bacterium]|nr:hypothetical protein [Deltaproteobacteria bacterium]